MVYLLLRLNRKMHTAEAVCISGEKCHWERFDTCTVMGQCPYILNQQCFYGRFSYSICFATLFPVAGTPLPLVYPNADQLPDVLGLSVSTHFKIVRIVSLSVSLACTVSQTCGLASRVIRYRWKSNAGSGDSRLPIQNTSMKDDATYVNNSFRIRN
jgi:hypothetical protein